MRRLELEFGIRNEEIGIGTGMRIGIGRGMRRLELEQE